MKTKLSKHEETFSQGWWRFCLDGHYRPITFTPDESHRVVNDTYRKPEMKIAAQAAAPFDAKESEGFFSIDNSPPHKVDVVSAAANAEKALIALLEVARSGNGKALWQLARIMCDLVSAVNQIADMNPDAIKPFSKTQASWPLKRSTAPHLCDDDALLEKIKLGNATGLQLDKYSKWKPDYAASVAFQLKRHIERFRKEIVIDSDDGKKVTRQPLPPFNKDSADQWWKVAECFLLGGYPKPEEIAELDALVTAKSKRKFPSTRRQAILEKIKARFFHLAC